MLEFGKSVNERLAVIKISSQDQTWLFGIADRVYAGQSKSNPGKALVSPSGVQLGDHQFKICLLPVDCTAEQYRIVPSVDTTGPVGDCGQINPRGTSP